MERKSLLGQLPKPSRTAAPNAKSVAVMIVGNCLRTDADWASFADITA